MRTVLISAVLAMAAAPAFAVVQVAPAPEIGFGLPAIFAIAGAAVIVFLLRKRA